MGRIHRYGQQRGSCGIRDPFAKLLARSRVFSAYSIPASSVQKSIRPINA